VLLDIGMGNHFWLGLIDPVAIFGEHAGLVNEKTAFRLRGNKTIQTCL
jgi:hypothetical protein